MNFARFYEKKKSWNFRRLVDETIDGFHKSPGGGGCFKI